MNYETQQVWMENIGDKGIGECEFRFGKRVNFGYLQKGGSTSLKCWNWFFFFMVWGVVGVANIVYKMTIMNPGIPMVMDGRVIPEQGSQ